MPADRGSTSAPAPHPFASFLLGLGVLLLLVIGGVVTYVGIDHTLTTLSGDSHQEALAPFYRPPVNWAAQPVGALLRAEHVSGVPSDGVGWRVLYVSQDAAGAKVVTSGLVFAPRRGVVPWAHPTVGMGDQCAPSRTSPVESDVPGLANFLASGWVVAATDYAGLGTAGTEQYLVGAAEAHDVLNSVRAARALRTAHAGTRVAIFGHSQGGQAALWTADAAPYAPELSLVGVAAAAPAAELVPLIDHQWSSIYGSLIGAEVLISYPATYPQLHLSDVTSRSASAVSTPTATMLATAAGCDGGDLGSGVEEDGSAQTATTADAAGELPVGLAATFRHVLSLWRYTVPLLVVYFAEYVCQVREKREGSGGV